MHYQLHKGPKFLSLKKYSQLIYWNLVGPKPIIYFTGLAPTHIMSVYMTGLGPAPTVCVLHWPKITSMRL